MVKEGQIYKGKYGTYKYVVTFPGKGERANQSNVISNKGIGSFRYNIEIEQMKLLAEYPTWQEAVNSKEFKDE